MHPDTLLSSKVTLATLRAEVVFFERFAQLIASDVPLLRAIDIAAEELTDAELQEVIRTIKLSLEQGESIGDAFRRYPSYFSKFAIAVVDSGEREGRLEENLIKLAESLRREIQRRQEVESISLTHTPSALGSGLLLAQETAITAIAKRFAETFVDAVEQMLTTKLQKETGANRRRTNSRSRSRKKVIQHQHSQKTSAMRRKKRTSL
jgi:type II secretory pathway component PulF